ncbi:MAG: hypothetical protein P1U54_14850 [Immundisolibacteraceae bacterium]|nr:hypothetical protein [Immundisolibacteraceae bacterium]
MALAGEDQHLYEVIPDDGPVRLYFDVEWVTIDKLDNGLERVVAFANHVSETLSAGSVAFCHNRRRVQGGFKLSYHLVFPTCVYERWNGLRDVVEEVIASCQVPVADMIDLGVYSRRRLFRLPFQTKGKLAFSRFVLMQGELSDMLVGAPEELWEFARPVGWGVPPPVETAAPASADELTEALEAHLAGVGAGGRVLGSRVRGDRREFDVGAIGSGKRVCPGGVEHDQPALVVVRKSGYVLYHCRGAGHVFELGRVSVLRVGRAEAHLGEYKHAFQEKFGGSGPAMAAFKRLAYKERLVFEVASVGEAQLEQWLENEKFTGGVADVVSFVRSLSQRLYFKDLLMYLARDDVAAGRVVLARDLPHLRRLEREAGVPGKESRLANPLLSNLVLEETGVEVVPSPTRPRPFESGQVTLVAAAMGAGKTHAEVEGVKAVLEATPGASVISINARTILSKQKCERYHDAGLGLQYYKEVSNLNHSNFLAVQVESLYRVQERVDRGEYFSVVILDELLTVLTQLLAPTNGRRMYDNYTVFAALVKNATTIYAGDALLDGHALAVMRCLLGPERGIKLQRYEFQPLAFTATLYSRLSLFLAEMMDVLEEGGKVFLGTASTRFFETKVWARALEILEPQGRRVLYVSRASTAEERMTDWGDPDFGLVVVSPLNTVGFTYDAPGVFHRVFTYACTGSCDMSQSLQQSRRVRWPVNPDLAFYIGKPARLSVWQSPAYHDLSEVAARLRRKGTGVLHNLTSLYNIVNHEENRTGTLRDYLTLPLPTAKTMPEWMLLNYAYTEMKRCLHQTFPERYLEYLVDVVGVKLAFEDGKRKLEKVDDSVGSGWWKNLPVVSKEVAQEMRDRQASGSSSLYDNRCLIKYNFCRQFTDEDGRPLNKTYEDFKALSPLMGKLEVLAALRRADNAQLLAVMRRRVEGRPVEQWRVLSLKVEILRKLFGAMDTVVTRNFKMTMDRFHAVIPVVDEAMTIKVSSLSSYQPTFYRGILQNTSIFNLVRTALEWVGVEISQERSKGKLVETGKRRVHGRYVKQWKLETDTSKVMWDAYPDYIDFRN